MKGNKKLLIVAVLLLLIAVSYGTYAIYRESTTAEGSVDAAAWSVTIAGDTFDQATLTFDLDDLTCTTNPGKNGKIAPGAECYIDYAIDADGSEVDVVVDAELDETNSTNVPENMEVSIGTTAGVTGPVTIPYSATDGAMETTIRLNVVWPGSLSDDDTKDGEDLDSAGDSVTLAVKVTARQALS